jgi:hypothetical protein
MVVCGDFISFSHNNRQKHLEAKECPQPNWHNAWPFYC